MLLLRTHSVRSRSVVGVGVFSVSCWCVLVRCVVGVLCVVLVCVVWHDEKKKKKRVHDSKRSPCVHGKTSPCVPAPRAHVFQHVRVVPAYKGDVLKVHTAETF